MVDTHPLDAYFWVFWNVLGVLGLAILCWSAWRLIRNLRGETWKCIGLSVGVGLIAGFVGLVIMISLSIVPFLSWHLNLAYSILYTFAALVGYVVIFACGRLAGWPLRAHCSAKAVTYVALMLYSWLLFRPVGYYWLKRFIQA